MTNFVEVYEKMHGKMLSYPAYFFLFIDIQGHQGKYFQFVLVPPTYRVCVQCCNKSQYTFQTTSSELVCI